MAAPPAGQSCATCRFFHRTGEDSTENEYGFCRRYPQQVYYVPVAPSEDADGYYDSAHPEAYGYEWCGEWAPSNPDTFSDAVTAIARLVLLGDQTAAYALVDRLTEDRGTAPQTEGG